MVCWDTAYFSPTALLWNHSKSSETVAILDDTLLRVLLSQLSQQDTEMTWGWEMTGSVENLNRNYSHNLFFLKRIHINYIKKNNKFSHHTFFDKQHRIYRKVLTICCYFIFIFFSGALLCRIMCFWVEQRFLSFTLWPHTRFVSYAGKKGVLLFSLILLHTCRGKPEMYLCVWVSCSSCAVHELACHTNAIVVRNAWCHGVETNCLGLFQKAA